MQNNHTNFNHQPPQQNAGINFVDAGFVYPRNTYFPDYVPLSAKRAKEKANRRYRESKEYIDGLFNHVTSRLLVIRVDLAYGKQWAHNISLDHIVGEFDRFINNRRNNEIFDGWVGYIWKLEWSVKKGYHYHLIAFFDGHKHRQDEHIAMTLGEYWLRITNGFGTYWNCNDKKSDYPKVGIGMIDHSDTVKRGFLMDNAAHYLFKLDQQLPNYVDLSKYRVFGKGVMPQERTSAGGRPRTMVMDGLI